MQAGDIVKDRYEVLRQVRQQPPLSDWLAFDRVTNSPVSLRVIDGASGEDVQFRSWRAQVDRLNRLRDPHIVHVHEIETEGDAAYAIMDPVGGRTVDELLQGPDPMPLGEALAILQRVVEAVQGVFNSGIAHGWLCPSTVQVLLDEQGRPASAKLLVFGPCPDAFRPPEWVTRWPQLDTSCDIYSLGILLRTLLGGNLPAAEAEALAGDSTRCGRLQTLRPDLPENQASALQELLSRCVTRDPRQRFPRLSDLRRAMDSVLRLPGQVGQPSEKESTDSTQRVQRTRSSQTSFAVLTTRSGRSIAITQPKVSVGRNTRDVVNEVDLAPEQGSSSVSRRHMRLECVRGQWYLALYSGAKNKTYVRGQRVFLDQRVPLRDGDEIRAAGVAMTFHIARGPIPAKESRHEK